MVIALGKLEAAARQIDTAIRLFFSDGDAVAIHSLAVAANNVFADIAEAKNAGVSWRTRVRDDSGLSMKELKAMFHEEWNFFKHADRNPDAVLYFNERLSQDFIFMATLDCGDLRPTTCPMQAFQIWYIAANPKSSFASEPVLAEAMRALPGLATVERSLQIKRGAEFLREHCGK
jgi:hypothetical protein